MKGRTPPICEQMEQAIAISMAIEPLGDERTAISTMDAKSFFERICADGEEGPK